MNRSLLKCGIVALVLLLLFVAAHRWSYFPGDVAITRLIQSLVGTNLAWAKFITDTARTPWNYALVAGAALAAWFMYRGRGVAIALLGFGGVQLVGTWLQNLVARPRPTATLVQVVGSSAGFSFPSIFALTYGATFGLLLLLLRRQPITPTNRLSQVLCLVMLLIGGSARVALGAHWPSDVLCGYALSLCWNAFLLRWLLPRH